MPKIQNQLIELDSALDIFLIDCSSRNLSKKTISNYKEVLNSFFEYCSTKKVSNLDELTPNVIRQYIISLQTRNLSSHTQHDYVRPVRTFLNFCVREGFLEISPFDKVRMPKLDKKIMPAFTTDDIKKILKVCESERDKAIILFLLDTGARASELIDLNVGDVGSDGTVKITQGKGAKDRFTYIGNKTHKQLLKYLITRGKPEINEALICLPKKCTRESETILYNSE